MTVANKQCSEDSCIGVVFARGLCSRHYWQVRRLDPIFREKKNKDNLERYHANPAIKERKRIRQKSWTAEIYIKLGGVCVSCGERYDPNLSRSNIQIHHKFYDDDDERIKKKFKGNLGSKHHWEIRRMLKNGVNPEKKFCLLCRECNLLEGNIRQDYAKALHTFLWLLEQGEFEKNNFSPILRKMTGLMSRRLTEKRI